MTRGAALISVLTAAFLMAPAALAGSGVVPEAAAESLTSAGAAPGTPAPARTSGREDAAIVVSSITPQAPREPATPLTFSGTVANNGAVPLTGVSVRLRSSRQPFANRTEMQTFADGGPILDSSRRSVFVSQLAPSGKIPWEFSLTPAALELFRFGVYPITIELVDAAGRQLAAQRTFLPYAPKTQPVTRTKIAWALPLVDQPHRGDDATFVDAGLSQAVADGGRLGRILKLAETPSKGVSWFVDPALLDDAQAMSGGYSLRSGTSTSKKPADQNVADWLRRVRAALAKVPVSATPYADTDVTAVSHHGLDSATGIALDKGASVATDLLGKEVSTATNWPVGGVIDHDGLDALAVGDVRTVLLSAAALPANPPLTTTPNAATTVESVEGTVNVLLADPVLSQLLTTAGASAPGAMTLVGQRFLAETAMIAAEPSDGPRAVVAAPPRRWNPDPASVSALLKLAASAPWLRPVSLGSVKPGKTKVPRADLVYSEKDQQAELSKSYVAGVRKLSNRAELTATVTSDHRRVFDTALLRLTSTAWRGRAGNAGPLLKQIDASVTNRTSAISISTVEQRTLAGQNGIVPISVRNDLPDQEVTVGVRITSGNRKLLTIGPYESPVTISPGKTRSLDIPMKTNGDGETTLKVQLTSANGIRYGVPVQVPVTLTGYTAIALVIVGAVLTLVLAAFTLRVLRRHARRPAKGRRAGRPVPRPVPEPAQHREGPS
ncbi:DUF6049 family protein [Sphaerisporangium corydalis]|uniref:DUF6049 family protein n=1 Tax=Sphaerisporangium corydalis TaxID=1441875 RepID=A0ABV9EIH6_9ACTN|nr:DUF6049 family protein [Sphaerisporangium corydalis]